MSEQNSSDSKKGGGKGLVIAIVLGVAAASGGGAWFFSQKQAAPAAASGQGGASAGGHGEAAAAGARSAQAEYVAMDPAFVVNLSDDVEGRYLQVEVQLLTREEKGADLINQHLPVLRNRLLLLFGQQTSAQLRTREDKERLQAQALDEVKKALTAEAGRPVVEALYFTSFVMQ